MKASLISGHLLCAVAGIVVWQVAIHLPTDQPGVELIAAGVVGPPLFAAMSLGLIALAGGGKPAAEPVPVPRRAVGQQQRRELTRSHPSDMPIGTVITLAAVVATKEYPSDRHPWPWTSDGVAYTDEWAAGLLTNGGCVRTPEVAR